MAEHVRMNRKRQLRSFARTLNHSQEPGRRYWRPPKLAVTAMVSEQDFATLLDQRLKRMEAMRTVEARPQPQVEVKPPMSRIADGRSYRRILVTEGIRRQRFELAI
jgi:hypothetical protein